MNFFLTFFVCLTLFDESASQSISLVPTPACMGLGDSYCNVFPTDSNTLAVMVQRQLPYGIEYFPPACQLNIRRSICSNVYRKCSTGIENSTIYNVSNAVTSLWDYDMYPNVSSTGLPYPLPFQRPCLDICAAIVNSCGGIPELFGYDLNCNETTFDYADGRIALGDADEPLYYDSVNNASTCNKASTVDNTAVLNMVGGARSEPFLNRMNPAAACYGLVDYDIYISTFPTGVLQLPYQQQYMIETVINQRMSFIPKWLEPVCYKALMKYACASAYMPSVAVNIDGENLYVASRPARSLCTDYNNTCYKFFSYMADKSLIDVGPLSMFHPQCDLVDSNGIPNFPPDGDYVDLQIRQGRFGEVVKNVNSRTNSLAQVPDSAFSHYHTQCPDKFVVPDNPDDPEIWWVPGTGCAVPCIAPLFTDEEWANLQTFSRVILSMGIVLISFVLFTNYCNIRKRSGYFYIRCFFILSAIDGIWSLIMHTQSWNKQFCRDNANTLTVEDGMSMCIVQSALKIYLSLGGCGAWTLQCVFLFIKLVMEREVEPTPQRLIFSCFIIFGLPIISVLYLVLVIRASGANSVGVGCFVLMDNLHDGDDLNAYFYPVLCYTLVGVGLMTAVATKIVTVIRPRLHMRKVAAEGWAQEEEVRSRRNTTDSSTPAVSPAPSVKRKISKVHSTTQSIIDSIKLLKPIIIFVLVFLLYWIVVVASRFSLTSGIDEVLHNFEIWYLCIFRENNLLDKSGTAAAQLICGDHLKNRPSNINRMVVVVFSSGYCLIVAMIELRESINYWVDIAYPAQAAVRRIKTRYDSEGNVVVIPSASSKFSVGSSKNTRITNESDKLFVEVAFSSQADAQHEHHDRYDKFLHGEWPSPNGASGSRRYGDTSGEHPSPSGDISEKF